MESTTYCRCCGRERPTTDFRPGALICSLCAMLPAAEASALTRDTCARERAVATQTAAGRKAARIEKRMAQYAQHGKRCSACHHYKSIDHYNKCAPQPDGLQPVCKECHTIRLAATKAGGRAQWHVVRAALRASSPEGK